MAPGRSGFFPWVLPREIAQATLCFGLWARYGRRADTAAGKPWMRTAFLVLAGLVEMAAALHFLRPAVES